MPKVQLKAFLGGSGESPRIQKKSINFMKNDKKIVKIQKIYENNENSIILSIFIKNR